MNSTFDRQYELTQTIDVPEIAPLPAIRSERAKTVAKWFGIDDQLKSPEPGARYSIPKQRALLRSLLPASGQITFFTGPSGAGKSSLLRAMTRSRGRVKFVDLNQIVLPEVPLVDCFENSPLDETLALLSQVGLAEAWTYLRTPVELSEGQRWRLRLALAMTEARKMQKTREGSAQARAGSAQTRAGSAQTRAGSAQTRAGSAQTRAGSAQTPVSERYSAKTRIQEVEALGKPGSSGVPSDPASAPAVARIGSQVDLRIILVADEFAALLDRITAAVVARCLRRAINNTTPLAALIATSHEDLIRALAPDAIVNCDFRVIEVRRKVARTED